MTKFCTKIYLLSKNLPLFFLWSFLYYDVVWKQFRLVCAFPVHTLRNSESF